MPILEAWPRLLACDATGVAGVLVEVEEEVAIDVEFPAL